MNGIDRPAERHDRAGARVVAIDGFITVPLRFGKVSEDSFHLRRQGRRGDRLRQKAQARAFLRFQPVVLFVERTSNLGDELRPWPRLAAIKRRLRTIRIVKRQN